MLLRIDAKDLKIGMFVAELDRPWIDTPFLIQGFLIQNPDHVVRVREHCHYVYVDPVRSAADVVPTPRPKQRVRLGAGSEQFAGQATVFASALAVGNDGQHAPASGSTRNAADDDQLSDTGRFMRMAHSAEAPAVSRQTEFQSNATSGRPGSLSALAKRLIAILTGSRGPAVSLPAPTRHRFIPPSIQLIAHPETRTVEQEFPDASQIFDKAKYVIARMIADLLAGRTPNLDAVWDVVDNIVDSMLRNPDALTWVAMTRKQDATLYGQGIRNAVYLVSLGRHLGLPKGHLVRLGMIGALLDAGKTALPLAVLTKPGQLSDSEFALVKDHVNMGLEMIKGTKELHADIIDGIARHHEREDGSGYPDGLAGDDIGLFGRMAAIVDCFVALTNERTYAETISPYTALRKLTEWSGKLFYAPLIEQLIQAIGVFPVGSLVDLSTDEVAVVIRQSRIQRLKPQVLIVRGPDKAPLGKPVHVDLLEQEGAPSTPQSRHIVRGLPAGAYGIDGRILFPA